jgi:hypothetical protein
MKGKTKKVKPKIGLATLIPFVLGRPKKARISWADPLRIGLIRQGAQAQVPFFASQKGVD